MAEKQRTIKKTITLNGKGLHTGLNVELTFNPAPVNHGVIFQRVDLEGKPIIRALVENVVDTSRSTVLEENGARIGTVEHAMSAIFGLGIDNITIEVNAPETPIMDGSAKYFTRALLEAGIEEQEADKDFFVVKEKIVFSDEANKIELMIVPDDKFNAHVMIDYNSPILGNQYATLNSLNNYVEEISECRTFTFLRELEPLLKHNLIKGGDLDNAIVLVDKEVTQDELDRLADLFNKPRMQVKAQGVLNNINLKFFNEPARHKLLDIIGDMALIGAPIKGKVIATRPGHAANCKFTKILRKEFKRVRAKDTAPSVDLNATPYFDVNQIRKFLPHRPPFLLVDKILRIEGSVIVGLKNVTMNEPFFVGHFPDEPVFPGVLIIEAMAQVGGILVLHPLPDPENYSTYFLKIDEIKFRKKVVPGDTLIFKVTMTSPMRRGIADMHALAFVGENVVAEGKLMAQIIKNKT